MRKSAVVAGVASFALAGVLLPEGQSRAQSQAPAIQGGTQIPGVGPDRFLPPIPLANIEDMALLPGGRWLIGSGMKAGAIRSSIYAIDTKTRRFHKIYPARAVSPKAARPSTGNIRRSGCAAEPNPNDFAGHGLSFRQMSAGAGELYVVNHGGRESIEVFEVEVPASPSRPPTLKWRSCILAPPERTGNAVTWGPGGALYATYSAGSLSGEVQRWTRDEGWRRVPAGDAPGATGLASTRRGDKLYVSNVRDAKVVEITLGEKPARREVSLPFRPDNLSWTAEGDLLVAGLERLPLEVMNACRGSYAADCAFKGYVAQVDPRALAATCVRELGPTVTTVATAVGEELWIGSSRSLRILRLPKGVLAQCISR